MLVTTIDLLTSSAPASGFLVLQVYRMDAADIGCSLAEAAETSLYNQYLAEAAQTGAPAMHVVYINTSLKTKAQAHAVVPTITCTSSNVVQTVLQVTCCTFKVFAYRHAVCCFQIQCYQPPASFMSLCLEILSQNFA